MDLKHDKITKRGDWSKIFRENIEDIKISSTNLCEYTMAEHRRLY
jgi:hypothetical protein